MAYTPPAFGVKTQNHPEIELESDNQASPLDFNRQASASGAYPSSSASTSTVADPNSSSNYYSYDVFINHRGPDIKKTFASHLYRRLLLHGVRAFLDKQELQEGDNFTSQIEGAIRTASVHVAIFSLRYAESYWCLNELLLMLESGAAIIPVFYHVKPSELRWTQGGNGLYAQALQDLETKKTHENKPRYDSVTVQNWRNALSRVAGISGFELDAYGGDEGELVDKIVERVLKKVKTTALFVAKYPTGLDEKVKDFERTVLLQQEQSGKPQVVGIVGSGGVGKTTLATELFNRKRSNYSRSYFLFDIREKASENSLHSLQSKLLKGLTQCDFHIESVSEGIEMIKHQLSYSNALIILDDVDDVNQVNAFLPVQNVLRSDSLILITSRDRDVLRCAGVQDSSIYKLSGLNTPHSRELFCSHAFSRPYPLPGFEYFVNKFLEACDGLPLSLKVFGAHLYGKHDPSYWKDQLDRIRQILPHEIQKRLRISYDVLDRDEKQVFLDIACFFIGENKEMAIRIWNGSGWNGSLVFKNLQNKCIVEVDSEDNIKMHDHFRDMGREIVVEASGLPRFLWRRTENIDDLLQQSYEITEVRGIRMLSAENTDSDEDILELSWGKRWIHSGLPRFLRRRTENSDDLLQRSYEVTEMRRVRMLSAENTDSDEEILELSWGKRWLHELFGNCRMNLCNGLHELFLNFAMKIRNRLQNTCYHGIGMTKLQLLDTEGGLLQGIMRRVYSPNLIWLRWSKCPYYSVPSWIPMETLRVLQLSGSLLRTLWEDKPQAPLQLRELRVNSPLSKLPESIGRLEHLELIVLEQANLKTLPNEFCQLRSLKRLLLTNCTKLKSLPDCFGYLRNLNHIDLSHSENLERLPNSFGDLIGLKYLDLKFCSNLTMSRRTLGNIRGLTYIDLSYCEKIEVLPPQVPRQRFLEKLYLDGTNLIQLPSALEELTDLEVLRFGSRLLKTLPPSLSDLSNLKELTLTNCKELKGLPDSIGLLAYLTKLTVKDCSLRELPFKMVGDESETLTESRGRRKWRNLDPPVDKCMLLRLQHLELHRTEISQVSFPKDVCPNLQHLIIRSCNDLVKVGTLPSSLIKLELTGCSKLRKLNGLCGLATLQMLDISRCRNVERLPNVETLLSLEVLDASGCLKLKNIKGLAQLTNLRVLYVYDCFKLKTLPGVERCMSLERLHAYGCPKLQRGRVAEQLRQRLKARLII